MVADHRLATFVAGADDRGLDRGLVAHLLVAEIEAGQGRRGGGGARASRGGSCRAPGSRSRGPGSLLRGSGWSFLAPVSNESKNQDRVATWTVSRESTDDALPWTWIPYFSASLLSYRAQRRRRRAPKRQRIEPEPVAAGRDGDEQAGDQLDQVLVDDPVMPLGLGVGRQVRPGRDGEIEQRQEGRRADGGERSQKTQDQADADRDQPVGRQPVGAYPGKSTGANNAPADACCSGVFTAITASASSWLLATIGAVSFLRSALERPPRLPGTLTLVGQGVGILLGLLDLFQLAQVLLARLAVVDRR